MFKQMKRMGTKGLLAGLLAMSTAAGCSSNANTGQPQGGDGGMDGKPIQITWLSFNPPENDNSPVQKALEKKFNVQIKNIRIERQNYREQINLKISGGEVPDLIYLDGPNDIYDLANQGVLAELPEKEIRSKMPAYAKSVDEADPKLWKNGLVDGKSFAVPLYWPAGRLPFLPGYNGDWLKKIGYDHAPRTLQEFEDVLRKFRDNDPDGNGKKDTIGYSGQGADNRTFQIVMAAYQVKWGWMADDKGTIYQGLTTDKMREALKLLNRWYKEGLIDREFITKKVEDAHQDFINGKVGIRDWQSFQFEKRMGIIAPRFYQKSPNTPIVVGKALQGPYGEGMAMSYGTRNAFLAMGAQVTKDTAKKDRIYKMMEALATDDATYLLSVYGIEGEHYQMVGGKPIMKPEFSSEATKYKIGAGTFYGLFGNKSKAMEKYDYPDDAIQFMNSMESGVKIITPVDVFVPAQSKYPDLGKIEQEFFVKAISGEINLDTEFNAFVDKWKKSGGDEILNEINKKYAGVYKK
ncbi:extracellular solute-binding protein [Paenibacillus allorhizosphaerae]|uniref:Lipoprotein LipO n=1 Tax=Paenibacillus allorhizosphaerae TaxID=2849866 RepID=A0ABM8VJF5_9BACL|nr:extracellular solute-binding protein [Paenibacillus allorhizosphaerae]CAG7645406.1 Lipoprotein LipO [Paenibacillus allorhizosphaerae]